MTKADLIATVAEKTGLTKREATAAVDSVFDTIRESLMSGEKVQLIPFGSFEVRHREKREGRNPKTGEKLVIPARRVAAFSAGKGLRDAVATAGKRRKRS